MSLKRVLLVAGVSLLCAACAVDDDVLGERIYQRGEGLHGRLDYRQGPAWLAHAAQGCSVCHGAAGEGRLVRAGKHVGSAPPLGSAVLKALGYDAASLERAISEGVAPTGRELHDYMPRWALSAREMRALQHYLQTL